MARQIDLGSALPVTHNALDRISVNPVVGQFDPAQLLAYWQTFLQATLLPLIDDLTGIDLTDLEALLDGKWSILAAVQQALQGIDLANPGAVLAAISRAATVFNGVIPVSWIADIAQDLLGGSGNFATADSVAENPAFTWNSNGPAGPAGGSVQVSADGRRNVLGSPTFDVAVGQILNQQLTVTWSGLVCAADSDAIQIGFRLFDSSGNALADVIGGLTPDTADGDWQPITTTTTWTVPAGVASVA